MVYVTGIGNLDYNRDVKNGDTNLVLYLDNPPAGDGEINESETWDWDTNKAFIETSDVRMEIEMDHDFEQDRPLLLPRDIRWGLASISVDIRCRKVAYHWTGGKRVDIRISGMGILLRKKAFLRKFANMLSETARDMLADERFIAKCQSCFLTDEEIAQAVGEENLDKHLDKLALEIRKQTIEKEANDEDRRQRR